MAFCDKKKNASKSVFFFWKYIVIASKDPSFQVNLTGKPFYKIMNNSQIGAENHGEFSDFPNFFGHFNAPIIDRMFGYLVIS